MHKEIYKDCLVLMAKDIAKLQLEIMDLLARSDKLTETEMMKETESLEGWLQDLG